MTPQTFATAAVVVEQSTSNLALVPNQNLQKAAGVEAKPNVVEPSSQALDAVEEIVAAPNLMSKGTYSVHHDECYSIPDFYESAYAKRQPWQEHNTKFGTTINQRGHYRSLFTPGGSYRNFYDIFAMSQAPSFYKANHVPTFYSDEENCTETSISLPRKGKDFEGYRPFAVESRGYTRSYFYGESR